MHKAKWRETPINERAKILYRAADILQERIVDLSDILIREIAKDRKSANQKSKELLILLDLLLMLVKVLRRKL